MSFMFSTFKVAVLTIVVLLMSQIQVNGRRICDHVGDIALSSAVQKPIQVLSQNLDFTGGKAKTDAATAVSGAVRASRSSR